MNKRTAFGGQRFGPPVGESTASGAKRRSCAKQHPTLTPTNGFEQAIEKDIVGSTGVVKGGSAPPLLPRPAYPVFDLASEQPEIAEHAVVQGGEFGHRPTRSQFSFDASFHDRHKRGYCRNEASYDRTRPVSPHDDAMDFIKRFLRVHFHFLFLLSCIAATIDARER
jgi:hypothetical protein